MLFSIIIPVYNVEKYLQECVNSVLIQDFSDYEIILVNDGATDNSPTICDEYEKKYSQIKVIHKNNGGLSDARNFGIKEAMGDYLIFLDSDDFWRGEKILSDLFVIIKENNPDIIIHGFTHYYDISKHIDTTFFQLYKKKLSKIKQDITKVMNINIPIIALGIFNSTGWNKIVKREIVKKHNMLFPLGKIHEDVDWCFNLLKYSKNIFVYQNPFYYYRQNREGSITHHVRTKNVSDTIDIISNNIMEAKSDVLKIYLLQHLWQVYFYYGFFSLPKNERDLLSPKLKECEKIMSPIIKENYHYLEKKAIFIKLLGFNTAAHFFYYYYKFKQLL
jgi:hypothetical protein